MSSSCIAGGIRCIGCQAMWLDQACKQAASCAHAESLTCQALSTDLLDLCKHSWQCKVALCFAAFSCCCSNRGKLSWAGLCFASLCSNSIKDKSKAPCSHMGISPTASSPLLMAALLIAPAGGAPVEGGPGQDQPPGGRVAGRPCAVRQPVPQSGPGSAGREDAGQQPWLLPPLDDSHQLACPLACKCVRQSKGSAKLSGSCFLCRQSYSEIARRDALCREKFA